MAYIGTSPSNAVRRVHTYTATAGQEIFTGSSTEGVTLTYADTNYIDVFQNGVLLGSADYTSTSGTSVVLAQGASVSDLVVIVVYDVFSVADTVSKTSGGTFDGGITVSGASTLTGALSAKGGAVFNEDSADVDFRVESNGAEAMLFVDGGNNRIGINTTSPQCQIHSANSASNALRVSGSGNNNAKVEIGFDTSNGAYLKAGSSVVTKLQFYVDNVSLAGEFRSNGDFYTNDGTVHSLSDSRIKKDIADLTDGLDIVNQLQPRTFKYNGKATTLDDDRTRYGFVADEVMAVASQYVSEETQTIDDVEVDDFKSLSSTKMIPMLVKAIQELSTKNEALTARITALENGE